MDNAVLETLMFRTIEVTIDMLKVLRPVAEQNTSNNTTTKHYLIVANSISHQVPLRRSVRKRNTAKVRV
jgi:hypothetical protein